MKQTLIKKGNRVIAFMLVLAVVFTTALVGVPLGDKNGEVKAATASSGTFYGIDWELDTDGNLTLHGGTATEEKGTRWIPEKVKTITIEDDIVANNHLTSTEMMSSTNGLFYNCANLIQINNLDKLNTSNVTNMSGMFRGCDLLQSLDLSSFNISNVTNMSYMFSDCYSLQLLDLSSFNTTNVTNMSSMFFGCNLSIIKTPKNLGSNYPSFGNTMYDINGNAYSQMNIANATLYGYRHLASSGTYYGINWTMDANGNLQLQGGTCNNTRGTKWTSSDILTVTLKGEIIANSKFCNNLFNNSYYLETISNLNKLNTTNVTNMSHMFKGCHSLQSLNVSKFNTNNVVDMSSMFDSCYLLQSLDLSSLNTNNVTDMTRMFGDCYSLQSLNVSKFNTSNVTTMQTMFYNCRSLQSLNLSSFNTSNVATMQTMFTDCYSLQSLDLSNFNMSNVTNMNSMLNRCSSLTSLKTPKAMGSAIANLPITMYDELGHSYTTLSTENTNKTLTSENPIPESTITFDKQGGTGGSDNTTVIQNSAFTTITVPTKTGYTFTGYYDNNNVKYINANGTSAKNWDKDSDTTLYAHWEKNSYTITYNLDGGSIELGQPENPTSYAIDSTTFTLTNPTRVGYTFAGWTGTDIVNATTSVTVSSGSIGNRTYTATWTPDSSQKFNITLLGLDGSDYAGDNSIVYDVTSETFNLPQPTKLGYDFAGWTGEGITTPTKVVTITSGTTGDKTYTANWTPKQYTVTLDSNGGSLGDSNVTVTYGSAIPTITTPSKLGYIFDGYYDSNNVKYINANGTSAKNWDKTDENVTLTAKWNTVEYSLSFILNGGTASSTYPNKYTIETPRIDITDPIRTGYTFIGWIGTGLSNYVKNLFIEVGSTGDREYTAYWNANTNIITFDNNGGLGGASTKTVTYDNVLPNVTTPSKDGYTFLGYYDSTDHKYYEADGTSTVTWQGVEDMTLYAHYSVDDYSISYDLTGGIATGNNPTVYNAETNTFTLSNPTREGYLFNGWTGTDLNNATSVVTIEKGSIGNRSYTATWVENAEDIFAVTYDLAGGVETTANPATYNVTTPTFTLNAPEKLGYEFIGWTGSNGSTPELTVEIEQGSTGAKNYTANWTEDSSQVFNISYDLDGGTVTKTNPSTYDITTNSFTLNNPTKDGYTFIGWIGTDIASASTNVTISKGSVGNRSYTATWIPKQYTVTLDLNGGSSEDNSVTATYDYAIPTINVPTKLGYTFNGYYDDNNVKYINADGTSAKSWDKTSDTTLTAQWTLIEYSLSYTLNGGTVTGTYPSKYTIETIATNIADPTRIGYTFLGWLGTGLTDYVKNLVVGNGLTGDKEYIAYWDTNSNTITFDNNGGLGGATTQTATYDNVLPNVTTPSKNGYTFLGYYDATNVQYYNADGTSTKVWQETEDKTLYAHYVADEYNITYNLNGGTVTESNPATYNIETETFTLNQPTKDGYTFVGWTNSENTTPQTNVTITKGTSGDKNFVANWTINDYSITYHLDGGVAENPLGYNKESAAITLNNPTKFGHTFIGWTNNENTTPTMTVVIPTGSVGNKEFTANYTPITSVITFNKNGGTGDAENVNTAFNKPLNNVPTLTMNGYSFMGYYDANGKQYFNENGQPAVATWDKVEDTTLYARFNISDYNIVYNLDGGTATNPSTYNIETNTFTLTNPTKEGYDFVGWTGTGLTEPTMTVTIPNSSVGNRTYTANYQLKEGYGTGTYFGIDWMCDDEGNLTLLGGEVTTDEEGTKWSSYIKSVKANVTVTLNDNIAPGMFENNINLTDVDLTNVNTSNVTNTSNMFKNCSSLKTLDLSSLDMSNVTNTDGMLDGCTSLRNIKTPSALATQTPIPTPSKEGYVFVGWTIGNSETLLNEISLNTNGSVNYIAHYRVEKITLDNGEAENGELLFENTNNNVLPASISVPQVDGKTFEGYFDKNNKMYYDAEGNNVISNFPYDTNSVDEETLYARFSDNGQQGGGNIPNPNPPSPAPAPSPEPEPEPDPEPDVNTGEDIVRDTDVVETSETETTFNATYGEYLPSIIPPTSNVYGKNFVGFVDNNNVKYIDENGNGIKIWDKPTNTAHLHEQWRTKTTDINTVNINVTNPIIISSVEDDGNVLFDIDTSNSFYNITNSHIVSGVNENEKMASGDIEHYAKLTLTIPDELFNGENKINFNENTVVNINGEPNAKVVKVESINEPTNEITLIIKNTNAMGLTIYRLYNPYDGDHIHTDSLNAKNLLESWGWNFEGISSIASTDGDAVYRLYNPYSGEHFFTSSEIERFILLVKGWNDEGIAFYSPSNQGDAVHRLYNPNSGLHHFTKDTGEKDWLVLSGWNYEGIAWYEMK